MLPTILLISGFQKTYRRIGYIRARRHLVNRSMHEFTSWLRSIAKDQ